MNWLSKNLILTLCLAFVCSLQVAIINISTSHNDENICQSDEKNNDLECISHCCLTQFDSFNYPFQFFSFFDFKDEKKIIFHVFSNFHKIVEEKSNSPPKII